MSKSLANGAPEKVVFDALFSLLGLSLTWWIIALAFIAASIETKQNGFFIQKRLGRFGRSFNVIKIRTMRSVKGMDTVVTTSLDTRITPLGRFFRQTKIDELPQLINILRGDMSFVGPRPDVPGFADRLVGEDRIVLAVRPGITGPATLKYRKEEELLAQQEDPEQYNAKVIFPDKVRINREYIECYNFLSDLKYIFRTLFH